MRLVKHILFSFFLGLLSLVFWGAQSQARVIFQNEFLFQYDTSSSAWVVDPLDNATGNITLQFGGTLGKTLTYDTINNQFSFNDDVDFALNQIKGVRIENSATAPLTPQAGQIYHNSTDGNSYIYNGSTWDDITAIGSTASKIVTVGTGLDYATIADAATYLNTLSGGIILLSAETHAITTAVNLTNITLIGKDAAKTTITMSGAGQIDAFDSRFSYLTLDVNAITDDMAIDVQSGASSLQFEWVDVDIQDSGDSLIDSNAGTAPTSTITFENCDEIGGAGTIVKTEAGSNLNLATSIFISGASGVNPLKINDWDVLLQGEGNVLTTGTLTTIPSNTIVIYPGMNLQSAVNSLPSGGSITLLSGTHSISSPLSITSSNIEIRGYGDASVISASGFTGITNTTAAIHLGTTNGTAPVSGVQLRDFKVAVSSNIHGIRVAGGSDNGVKNVTVQKISGTSGTAATANIGIMMLDGASTPGIRPVVQNSRVLGNGGANYFTDGIHITSETGIGGVWGFGQGIENALLDGNYVDYVRETGYVFLGVESSSLFNNRSTRMGAGGGGAYGIYMGNSTGINMSANVFSGSLATTSIAIGLESFNVGSAKTLQDSLFVGNIIDGEGNGGVGFGTGFQIGAATNTNVLRNIIKNNIIRGASNGTTVGIVVRGNADDNEFSENYFVGSANPWDTGIDLQSATQERNGVRLNKFVNTTVAFTDGGTSSIRGVSQRVAGVNPTATDDSNDGYIFGTLWVNTVNDTSYILVDDTAGAAVWNQIDGGGGGPVTGTTSNTFTLDTDNTGGNVSLVFGTTLAETLQWTDASSRFDLSDDLNIAGTLAQTATSSTTSTNGITANLTQTTNGANITGAGVQVNLTASGDAGDTIYGVNLANITGTSSTEYGLNFGTGYDREIVFSDTTPVIGLADGSDLTITDGTNTIASLRDLSTIFGATMGMGAFLNYNSYIGEEFSRERGDLNADGNQTWGDFTSWGVDENGACIFSTVDDTVNGIGRIATAGGGTNSCLAYHSAATGNAHLLLNTANRPVFLMKVRPSNASATHDIWVGAGTDTAGSTAPPTNGVFFTNNDGTTWTGVTRSGGTSTPVSCGQTISTTEFALLKIEVISTTEVRFFVDPDTSNGIDFTSCGTSTTNIPTVGMTTMLELSANNNGTALDVDFYRVWTE